MQAKAYLTTELLKLCLGLLQYGLFKVNLTKKKNSEEKEKTEI